IDQSTKSSQLNELFFNCTPPWFGVRCQYSFELVSNVADRILNVPWKSDITDAITHQTCYILLECDRGPAPICLDWREICNGRIDCFNNGVDESQCFELEINECNENEYRCYNGLCISKFFLADKSHEAECLDQSDLPSQPNCPTASRHQYIFECEEYVCRPGEAQFPCGDGQCVKDFDKCENGRHLLLAQSLSVQGYLSYDCWIAIVCLSKIIDQVNGVSCEQSIDPSQILLGLETCEYPVQFPTIPVLLDHVRFLYHPKQIFNISVKLALIPDYVCYDEQLCDFLRPTFYHGNLTCRHRYEMGLKSDVELKDWKSIIDSIKPYFHGCINFHYHIEPHNSSLYACKNSSKYIPKYRLIDGISDCVMNDDEQVSELSCLLNHPHRLNCLNDIHCQSLSLLRKICQSDRQEQFDKILFYTICDRAADLLPMLIDGRNHSDETDCEHWHCNNIYTRCDGFWSCKYGEDEENCTRPICFNDSLSCISLYNTTLSCLPANQVNDGIIDCLGASDEIQYCRQDHGSSRSQGFYCQNDGKCVRHNALCNGRQDCSFGDDEIFCDDHSQLCSTTDFVNLTDVEYVFCQIGAARKSSFSLDTASMYPSLPITQLNPVNNRRNKQYIHTSPDKLATLKICHYGLDVNHWLGIGNISVACFCPPNYYGDRCQYQNQRVSLTLSLGVVERQLLYAIVVRLFEDDNDRQEIHSSHQLTYLPKRACGQLHKMYLLYSVRSKNNSKNYSIHIDAFDKSSLTYQASWYLKIPFVFLPVNRMAIFLTLPISQTLPRSHCSLQCNKGVCMKYLNEKRFFCRCHSGWSGAQCHLQINCTNCSSNSICVGSIQNQPICVCPFRKFGSRCLTDLSCPENFCENNGRCVVADGRMTEESYACICPEGFFGTKCEEIKSKIEVSFQNIKVPLYAFAYIYSDVEYMQPSPIHVILQKVKMFQNIITFYSRFRFQMVILKTNVDYYLAVLQPYTLQNISTTISPAQQCVPYQKLFSPELLALPRIHRLKSYHVPCQNNVKLQCFIDEFYMCLCTVEHLSNCFLFDSDMSLVCKDDVYCENGGKCLQDRQECPESILCVCSDCFFGNRCQFYAKAIGLTLDDILRYAIQPNITIPNQSAVIKWSAALVMLIFIIGLLNSLLTYMIFHHPNSRRIGSGMYLHLSSIMSGLVVSLLTIKFWFVVATHINQSVDRRILHGGCISIEIALKLCLHISNWLHACVTTERVITVIKGINFNKSKSKRVATWIIWLLPFVILGSMSYEFIYRSLFDDYEEQRIWCVFHYSQSVQKYITAIQMFHFIIPFSINLLASIFIIFSLARRRAGLQIGHRYTRQVLSQFKEHKQLVVSPIVLVILSFPRLLMSLFSGCVKVSRIPHLYLIGYFVSFIPPASIFLVFVAPSTSYKALFKKAIVGWRRCVFRS
ncbi:unnamed protein product, partial [Rotaria socialis]